MQGCLEDCAASFVLSDFARVGGPFCAAAGKETKHDAASVETATNLFKTLLTFKPSILIFMSGDIHLLNHRKIVSKECHRLVVIFWFRAVFVRPHRDLVPIGKIFEALAISQLLRAIFVRYAGHGNNFP